MVIIAARSASHTHDCALLSHLDDEIQSTAALLAFACSEASACASWQLLISLYTAVCTAKGSLQGRATSDEARLQVYPAPDERCVDQAAGLS